MLLLVVVLIVWSVRKMRGLLRANEVSKFWRVVISIVVTFACAVLMCLSSYSVYLDKWDARSGQLTQMGSCLSYFSTEVFEGEMAHARFYDEETRRRIPKCLYRKYTISEILNSIIGAGFTLKRFDEHPAWEDETLPGEFTAVAVRP